MIEVPNWQIIGDWFDNCSWAVACPCTFAQAPDNGVCKSVLLWHIRRGHYGDINLDNLSFVRVGRWEGDLWAGKAKGTAGIFIDERADERQAEVLPRIFGGHVGGFPALVAALFVEGRQVRGVERARITFEIAPDRAQVQWHFSGDYFENCNCSVVCPCFVSKSAPLTSRPTEGVCDVALIFHIESGSYDGMALDGLNVALAVHTPGPMGEGNWSVAAYIDQRASDKQTEALGAIFTGAAGGPMAQLAPLIGKNLGVSKVPIAYRIEGKKRSAEITGILHMSVDPLPTAHPSGEMWANTGHPVSPDKLVLAVGASGNTFNDHGMRWDNSGKNGHYAPISWSNHS